MNTITTIISVMGLMIEGGAVGIGEKRHHQYTSFFYSFKLREAVKKNTGIYGHVDRKGGGVSLLPA